MSRPRLRPGEETLRVTLSLSSTDVEALDALAVHHGGRSAAVRWLLAEGKGNGGAGGSPPPRAAQRTAPAVPAPVAARRVAPPPPLPPPPVAAPATTSLPMPTPAGIFGGAPPRVLPTPCPSCFGPTRPRGDGLMHCYRCDWSGPAGMP